ncbi:putative glycine dehydrogenase (decarboxylating) subunit 2 [subsurface metagenome]
MSGRAKLRKYHAAVWSEPIIMEMGRKGERGILIPEVEEKIENAVGNAEAHIAAGMRRKEPPILPELAQPQVIRHFHHLAHETLGMEVCIDTTGSATMKYSPKVNEILARDMAEIHPCQDEDTIQGILEILYKFDLVCRELSGMDQFTLQPGGGSQAVFTAICVFRAYHAANGELPQRNEVITSILSHPVDSAVPSTAGFKVINLMPGEDGYVDLKALNSVCSEHTAGLFLTNPEDTGIYNPKIKEIVNTVHNVGGLCFQDVATFNGTLGIVRPRDVGFDACHFNLHKTFSSPHGSHGPAGGAFGCKKELAKFLPVPVVTFDGEKYHLDYDRPHSIGRVREFLGNVQVVLKSYAWVMSMGAEGLLEVARISTLNNNYLNKLLLTIPGITLPNTHKRRLEQAKYSFQNLLRDTGCGTVDVRNRIVDFGVQSFFTSHYPWVITEPLTNEPCETYSKDDLDYWAAVLEHVCKEAYSDPDIVKTAPHNSSIHQMKNMEILNDPEKWAMTWRAYLKKHGEKGEQFRGRGRR